MVRNVRYQPWFVNQYVQTDHNSGCEKYGHPHKTGRTYTTVTREAWLHARKTSTEGWFELVLRPNTGSSRTEEKCHYHHTGKAGTCF